MLVLSARRLDAGLVIKPMRAGSADRLDGGFDFNRPSLLERQSELDEIALVEGLFQIHEHHMITMRRQHHRATGLQRDTIYTAHTHHIAVHDVGVKFGAASDGGGDRKQAVVGALGLTDFEVGDAVGHAARRRPRPRMSHRNALLRDLVGLASRRGGDQNEGGENSRNGAHLLDFQTVNHDVTLRHSSSAGNGSQPVVATQASIALRMSLV